MNTRNLPYGINFCVVCGAPVLRQRKVTITRGRFKGRYWFERSRSRYCSNACRQIAYRMRRRRRSAPLALPHPH